MDKTKTITLTGEELQKLISILSATYQLANRMQMEELRNDIKEMYDRLSNYHEHS